MLLSPTRLYDPADGRFLSRDPIKRSSCSGSPENSQGAYLYVVNTPLFLVDPDGRDYIVHPPNVTGAAYQDWWKWAASLRGGVLWSFWNNMTKQYDVQLPGDAPLTIDGGNSGSDASGGNNGSGAICTDSSCQSGGGNNSGNQGNGNQAGGGSDGGIGTGNDPGNYYKCHLIVMCERLEASSFAGFLGFMHCWVQATFCDGKVKGYEVSGASPSGKVIGYEVDPLPVGDLMYWKYYEKECAACDCLKGALAVWNEMGLTYRKLGPNSNSFTRFLMEVCYDGPLDEPPRAMGWNWAHK